MIETRPISDYYPELLKAAGKARKNSYSPYSHYKVGAALMCIDDKEEVRFYYATNVENASYGLTICAERAAFCKAIADGITRFVAIGITTDTPTADATSCGACRQFMSEFNLGLRVVTGRDNGEVVADHRLGDLLPHSFGPQSLERAKENAKA